MLGLKNSQNAALVVMRMRPMIRNYKDDDDDDDDDDAAADDNDD